MPCKKFENRSTDKVFMGRMNFKYGNFASARDILHDYELSFIAIYLLEHAVLISNEYFVSF